jgi:hypothetical protein
VKVLILGAGASKAAGYPLASELMPAIKDDVQKSKNLQLADAWARWEQTVNTAIGPLRLLLNDPNPEVALSALDLCAIAKNKELQQAVLPQHIGNVVSNTLGGFAVPLDWFTSPDHAWLFNADTALFRLIDCLAEYLDWKNHDDCNNPGRRDYLRKRFEELNPGDAIITLNWDTTVERTLCEAGRWRPEDGYGFEKKLGRSNHLDEVGPLPAELRKPSEIIVLKLHGSSGWKSAAEDHVYFDSDFLQSLPLSSAGEAPIVVDPSKPPYEEGRPMIAYPSFLKTLNNLQLRTIWTRADEVLRQASEIDVWGYSLPLSDSAVRALFNILRSRSEERAALIRVHLPDAPRAVDESDLAYEPKKQATFWTRNRWRRFLGDAASVDSQGLG